MLLGVPNAPIVFTDLMNRVCRPMLERPVIVFINEILVYSRSREQHQEHHQKILRVLRAGEALCQILQVMFLVTRGPVLRKPH